MMSNTNAFYKAKIAIVRFIVIIGFAICSFHHYILAYYVGLNAYPYNTFLFRPEDKFNDFYNIYNAAAGLDPYAFKVSVYFPFTFVVMYPFTFLKADLAYALYFTAFTVFLVCFISRSLKNQRRIEKASDLFVFTFLSYPFLFSVDRGNVEMLIFVFLALFVHFYVKGRQRISVIFLSLATAMKLYPAVFGLLYFEDKKYRNILLSALLVAALTVSSAAILKGGIRGSVTGLKRNLEIFEREYIRADHGLQHNCSLYGAVRIFHQEVLEKTNVPFNRKLVFGLTAALLGLVFVFAFFREKTFWKKICLLVLIILLLPQVSYDYKLIHLYIPLMLFLGNQEWGRWDTVYAALFGFLFIPKDYYLLRSDISIAVVINPLLMLSIAAIILYEKYRPGVLTSAPPDRI